MFQISQQKQLLQQAIQQSLFCTNHSNLDIYDIISNNDLLAQEKYLFHPLKLNQMTQQDIQFVFQEIQSNSISNEQQPKFITSLQINKSTKQLKFILQKDGGKSWLKHQYIGMPLKIYNILKYPHDISFSLNPNPNEQISNGQLPKTQVKWFSVDEYYKRSVLENTKFGQILFKADYMMKQLNIGLNQNNQKFNYPQDLAPLFEKNYDLKDNRQLSRYFLKINDNKKIISFSQDKQCFYLQFTNPIIEVEARNMVIKDGKLSDQLNQDIQSPCYIIAKKFSQNYDVIAYHYPIFNELKGAVIGMALAKWIKTQNIQINNQFIQSLCKNQHVANYEKTIPMIKGQIQKTQQIQTRVYIDINGEIMMGNQQVELNQNQYFMKLQNKINILTALWSVTGGFNGLLSNNLFSTNFTSLRTSWDSSLTRPLLTNERKSILSSLSNNFATAYQSSNNLRPEFNQQQIQKQKIDMITKFQVSSQNYYNKKLSKPNYPGNGQPNDKSGVTIGIGCDLGHTTRQNFQALWKNKLPNNEYQLLSQAIGKKGPEAKEFIEQNKTALNNISISLNVAKQNFGKDLKRYEAQAQRLFPGIKQNHPNTFNSLVSMVYNRGSSLNGQSRREMREISEACKGNKKISESLPQYISKKIDQSKRVWADSNLPGLIVRRQVQSKNCLKDVKK